jgi:phosphatidylinositol alpha-1,6-mannosyltransferase
MRVLLVTPDYPPPPGGIQTLTRNLELGLQRQGHTVEVIESSPSLTSPQFFTTLPSLRPTALSRPGQLLRYPYFNHCYRRTLRRIDAFGPDVVHALHRVNWPALLAADQRDVPSVLTAHALELEDEQATRAATELATRVHAVSAFTADLVEQVAVTPRDSIAVIPPSIDLEAYRTPDPQNQDGSDLPVVTIARLVPRKNVETLLEGWRQVDQAVRADRELVVVGDGPRREALEDRFGGDENVSFVGWISEEDKRALLRSASLFALVPRRSGFDVEGFGIVYIEAQAAGTPVVGSQTGGVPEAIGDGGVLVEDETDPAEIAAAIESVIGDRTRRQKLVDKIESRVSQFDVGTVADRHLVNYATLE